MNTLILERFETGNQGTFGILHSKGFSIFTAELPWRDNVKTKSCIPKGLYETSWIKSPRFGYCYSIQEVPNRSHILFHSGNYVGDVCLGFISNSHGCILPCLRLGYIKKQKAGLSSLIAVRKLIDFCNKDSFLLEIKDDFSSVSTI